MIPRGRSPNAPRLGRYGVNSAQFADPDYAGYAVAANVQRHEAWGVGVYSFFRDFDVTVRSGIIAPAALEASFHSPLTVKLNGYGGIEHVINARGGSSVGNETTVNYVC